MPQQTRRPSTAASLLGYGGAAIGLIGGLVLLPALPFAAALYMLPLGAALGAGIAVALPSHDASGTAIKKPLAQKIVDGFLGAFVGAIGATLIPASPLAALGAAVGYGAGETIGSALRPVKQAPASAVMAPRPVVVPETADTQEASALKSGLSNSFKAGQSPDQDGQSTAPQRPAPKP